MRLLLCGLVFALAPVFAAAQERDSVFRNYVAYDAFIDDKIMTRNFIPLVQVLGGRDEYTKEQLAAIQRQFDNIYPIDFRHKTIFKRVDLGGGMSQEARAYWIGERYIYFYALLHNRGEDTVVVTFHMNSSVTKVLAKF